MASRKSPKERLLREYLERRRPARVGEIEWNELTALLAPVTDRTLRKLLRESGWPLHPLVEGVRQESFEELARTLSALTAEYEGASAAARQACRDAVILARDHARFALRSAARRADKEEMILWMRTWLENPPVFPAWLELRRRLRENISHESKPRS